MTLPPSSKCFSLRNPLTRARIVTSSRARVVPIGLTTSGSVIRRASTTVTRAGTGAGFGREVALQPPAPGATAAAVALRTSSRDKSRRGIMDGALRGDAGAAERVSEVIGADPGLFQDAPVGSGGWGSPARSGSYGFDDTRGQIPAFLRLIAMASAKNSMPQAIWSRPMTTLRSWT